MTTCLSIIRVLQFSVILKNYSTNVNLLNLRVDRVEFATYDRSVSVSLVSILMVLRSTQTTKSTISPTQKLAILKTEEP